MSDRLTVKDALNSVAFCNIIQEFDLFDDVIEIVEKFIDAFKRRGIVKSVESLMRYKITKSNQANFCKQVLNEVVSHDHENLFTIEKLYETLPLPSSNHIINKLKGAQNEILEEATAAAKTIKTNDFKVDVSRLSQREFKQVQLFYWGKFDQVDRLTRIFSEEYLEIIDLSGVLGLDELKEEMKRGEINKIPLFIVFDEIANNFLINENEQMDTTDFNCLSSFYRIIYLEYLRKFNNTRFFLLNTVDLEKINFQHIWLLHETPDEKADFEYLEPVFISNTPQNLNDENDAIKKFLKFEMETIMKMKDIIPKEQEQCICEV
jgi:hypothetical protein